MLPAAVRCVLVAVLTVVLAAAAHAAGKATVRGAEAVNVREVPRPDSPAFVTLRKGREVKDHCLVIVNFTPEIYRDYRIKVPFAGTWREVLNTDAAIYGGSNVGNGGFISTLEEGPVPEVSLVIPPLAAVFLVPEF